MGIFNDHVITIQSQKENINLFINNIEYALFILNLTTEPSSKTVIFRKKLLNWNDFDTKANLKEYKLKQKDGIISFSLYFYSPHNNIDHSFLRLFGTNSLASMKTNTRYKIKMLVYTQHIGLQNILQISVNLSKNYKRVLYQYLGNNKFTIFNLRFRTENINDLIIGINLSKDKPVKKPTDPELTPDDKISIIFFEIIEI